MHTPESREALRQTLPTFSTRQLPSLVDSTKPSPHSELQAYLDFYKLRFEHINDIDHYIGRFDAAGFTLVKHYYVQKTKNRGTVFVFHGYYDHIGTYRHVIEFALQQGFSVVMYDLPGHGLSSGASAAIQDFQQYQAVLAACIKLADSYLPKPWLAFGQSTGCAILTDYFLSQQFNSASSPFADIVFLAPLIRPLNWRVAQIMYYVVRPFRKTVKRTFSKNSGDEDFLQFLREGDPLQSRNLSVDWVGALIGWQKRIGELPPSELSPLIFQGDCDGTVDFSYNLKVLAGKFHKPEVVMLPAAGHQLVNETQDHRDKIFNQIRERWQRFD